MMRSVADAVIATDLRPVFGAVLDAGWLPIQIGERGFCPPCCDVFAREAPIGVCGLRVRL